MTHGELVIGWQFVDEKRADTRRYAHFIASRF